MQTLVEHVSGYRDRMVDLTTRLIAIPSENPPGNRYVECAELLRDELATLGFDEIRMHSDCVLGFLGQDGPTLYFHGHYDVVPAQNEAQFSPRLTGANLFGRGSSDMKSGLAAMIYAAVAARDAGAIARGRIGIVLVPDEETAGPRGSRLLAERGILGRDGIGMLTPEPTGGAVWNANRGAFTIRVTVRGKPAHVGRQHEGVNAFEQAIPLLQRLESLKREVESRGSILMMGGRAEGGTNFNVVPDRFSFTIDRRIDPDEDLDTEKERLLSVLAGVDVEVLQEGSSCRVAEDNSLGMALGSSIYEVTRKPARFEMCPGLLEIRFYAERGIPAFAYGPGLLTVSHGPDEFVPVDRIVDCATVYALTAARIFAADSGPSLTG
jgi:acetylornithine deacetylase/succinyl-diaminopimelate desuccinylase family protein